MDQTIKALKQSVKKMIVKLMDNNTQALNKGKSEVNKGYENQMFQLRFWHNNVVLLHYKMCSTRVFAIKPSDVIAPMIWLL